MTALTFHLIPHTHWDREWYATRAAFQARLIPVLDGVLAQLEADPSARFVLDGQTVLLEDYLAVKPEQEARLAAQVRRGALEIGPWYVLSDLLIPSAASLRRNLREGARDAERFGGRLPVLYSPDAFGHPAELPALAAEFGLRWAVIRRGLGRPLGRDCDLYRWESEGGALLVHHLPSGGYDFASDLTATRADLAARWAAIRRDVVRRAVTSQVAVFLGADHHAMVPELTRLCQRIQALEPAHQVRVSGLAEFFAAVEAVRPDPPVLRGELRRGDGHAWVLQDVTATRSRLKRRHGEVELLLSRRAEPLAQLAGKGQEAELRMAWRTLLQSQFHDTLAGTTCDAAQEEQEVRLATAESWSRAVTERSIAALTGHDPERSRDYPDQTSPRLVLWNPRSTPAGGIMSAELSFFRHDVLVGMPSGKTSRTGRGYRPFQLEASSGQRIPVQMLGITRTGERRESPRHYPDQDVVDRVTLAFEPRTLPAQGWLILTPRPGRAVPARCGLEAANGMLRNRFVSLRVNRRGVLTLTDQETGERYPGLAALEDQADLGDSYTFSTRRTLPRRGGRATGQSLEARGPLVGSLVTSWKPQPATPGSLAVRQVVTLHADSPLVRVRLEIDNQSRDHRLRLGFPVGAGAGTPALAGSALGSVLREMNQPGAGRSKIERIAATAPAQRFVHAGQGDRGLALLLPGTFQYEWTRGAELILTVLRAVGELSRDGLAERPGHAAWPLPTPAAQEPGLHIIEFALAPLGPGGNLLAQRLERLWEAAFLPVQSWYFREEPPPR